MSESRNKVLITPDPQHPGWYLAHARNLLTICRGIPSVEPTPSGIAFADGFAEEVRAALSTAGKQLIDGASRADTHAETVGPPRNCAGYDHWRYVSDTDNLTVLPDNTPGGHWQDESDTCPRCNPSHAAANAKVRADALATIRANLARVGTMPTD